MGKSGNPNAHSKRSPVGFKPFIPSWLDDLRLPPIQFRILAHLWRRAGKDGRCWPSAKKIAASCRINRDSVWPAITALEHLGLVGIERGRRSRNTNVYMPIIPPGGTGGLTDAIQSAESRGLQQAESNGQQSAETDGRQSAESRGLQGVSMKDIHLRQSSEGVSAPPPNSVFVPLDLTDEQKTRIADNLKTFPAALTEALRIFNGIKANYRVDWPVTLEMFEGWLRSSKEGKAMITSHPRRAAVQAQDSRMLSLIEPLYWRKVAAAHQTLHVYAKGTWDNIDEYGRKTLHGMPDAHGESTSHNDAATA